MAILDRNQKIDNFHDNLYKICPNFKFEIFVLYDEE